MRIRTINPSVVYNNAPAVVCTLYRVVWCVVCVVGPSTHYGVFGKHLVWVERHLHYGLHWLRMGGRRLLDKYQHL